MLKSIIYKKEFTFISVRKYLYYSIAFFLLTLHFACGSSKFRRLEKAMDKEFRSRARTHHHMGFMLYDPVSKDTLIREAADRYFVPASNLKVFTLYAALKLIPENIPVLKYSVVGDTLYFEGQADPSGLHPYFRDSTALEFLSRFQFIRYHPNNLATTAFAPGWAWEDYDQSFAPERNGFPLYGNVVSIYPDSNPRVIPGYFKDSVVISDMTFRREESRNFFYIPRTTSDSLEIPIKVNTDLTARLLHHSLDKNVAITKQMPAVDKEILSGISRDSIIKRMMVESDNFLAEQLLLAVSATLSDTLQSEIAIRHMLEEVVPEIKPPPKWVDGSGLSRYNLFTPGAMVNVLNRLYLEFGDTYIINFFPKGGVSGTLKEHFHGNSNPFIFAKSGSLGNIYCLSGYLKTESGRLLIFSFMNNHFTMESAQLKAQMASIFEFIRDNY